MNLAKLPKEDMLAIIQHKNDCYLRFMARKTAATLLKTKTHAEIRHMLKSSPDEHLRAALNELRGNK